MEKKEITIEDVMMFIIHNSENTEIMDKINKTTFPFTSKYLRFSKTQTGPGPFYKNDVIDMD